MEDILLLLFVLCGTYFTGSLIEKNHFKKIQKREIALIKKPIINFGAKKWSTKHKVKNVELVTGEVVIAGDYFKNTVASIKNFFGGRLTPFESILDRARREAVLRMREKVRSANIIVNVRIESIMMNNVSNKGSNPQCAVIAYGTAVTYEKQ